MAINGKVFTMADNNTETLGKLLKDLGGLLGVGPRDDGRYYLSDMCQARGINKWAMYKPVPLKDSAGNDVTDNAYTVERYYSNAYKGSPEYRTGKYGNVVGYLNSYFEVAGLDVPMIALNTDETLANQTETIVSVIENYTSNGKNWPKTPWSRRGGYKRIRDFDGYDHNAACPFIYSIDKDIAMNAYASKAGVTNYPYSNSIDLQNMFKTIFNDEFVYAAIFVRGRSSTSVGYQEAVVSSVKASAVGCDLQIPSTMLTRFANIRCYFFAYNESKKLAIPLPSTDAYPNPITTTVSEYTTSDPFAKLSQPLIGQTEYTDVFGYNTSTGISNMVSLRDASPSGTVTGHYKYAPSTRGAFIFSATLTNVAANNASVVVNPNNVRVVVTVNNNSSTKKILTPKVYGPTLALLTNNYTINAGGQMRFYFYLDNIWSGQSVTPSDTTPYMVGIQLTYYDAAYANNGYPSSYPNMGGFPMFAYYPSSTANDNKVAELSGTSVTFKSYTQV